MTCTADVSLGNVEVLRRVTEPGDGVIITPPVYHPFFDLLPEAGCSVVEVPLLGGIDEGWSLDLDGIDAAFAAGARAMLLCNPHNPTGTVPDAATLAALADIAARHDVTIVSDEVHGPLAQPATPYTPFLTVSDAAREHGVAVTAATKAFNLAGLKTALIVTASERGDRVRAALPYEVEWRMSQFGAIATIAAFREGGPWLDGVLASLDDNRRLLADLVADELPGRRATASPTRATSPGSTSPPSAGATTPPRTRWSTRGSPSRAGRCSGRPPAEDTRASTSRARPRCSTRRCSGWRRRSQADA